jgi:hypothetical protein
VIIISWADAAESSKDRFEAILFYIYYIGAAAESSEDKLKLFYFIFITLELLWIQQAAR